MLTDAELDELERLANRWEQFPTWTDSVRMGSAMRPALHDLRSARATIAEMRGRLEAAQDKVDAALKQLENERRWTQEGIDGIRALGKGGAFDSLVRSAGVLETSVLAVDGTFGAEATGDD